MDSLFQREPPAKPPPTPLERIGPEIAHLRKGTSTRYGAPRKKTLLPWLLSLTFCVVGWLYVMDPVLYSYHKGEAIRAYLYLHNYGSGPEADNLAATRIFSTDEVNLLNHQQGAYQDYFPSPDAAKNRAEAIIAYMKNVQLLHQGKFEQLDWIGQVRCYIFIRPGVPLPTQWSFLNPAIE